MPGSSDRGCRISSLGGLLQRLVASEASEEDGRVEALQRSLDAPGHSVSAWQLGLERGIDQDHVRIGLLDCSGREVDDRTEAVAVTDDDITERETRPDRGEHRDRRQLGRPFRAVRGMTLDEDSPIDTVPTPDVGAQLFEIERDRPIPRPLGARR
jgi:hypothetical protein